MTDTIIKTATLKGGEFLIKDSRPEEVFTPEDVNEEQKMIREMAHDFVIQVGERGGDLNAQVSILDEAGELGLLSSHIPEAYGGMPLDTNTNTIIAEELGKIPGGFTTTYAAHIGIGTLPILYFGTEAQKQKYLPKLATGELKAAYCLTEPSSGSDALAAKTRADLSNDGTHYILNGQKMWISNAGFADVFVVFAKIDGEHFTGFIVEKDSKGLSLGAEEKKLGIKGSSTRQVFFENVKVPVENLLGQKGKGHLIAFNILNVGRYKLGVMSTGGSKKNIDISVKYANERKQFRTPISSFGAIQYKLAEQTIRTFAIESTNFRVSNLMQEKKEALIAEGKTYEQAILEAAEEYAIECAMIKVSGSEVADYVIDEMVQIHGGYGFSEEYPAARAYRDSRIGRIYEGTNEINRILTVSQLMKRAMKGSLDFATAAFAVQAELASSPNGKMPDGKYVAEHKAVKDFKKAILLTAGSAMKMQMEGKLNLKEEQEILMNMADMMIDVFNAESTLLRVEKLAEKYDKPQSQEVYEAILKTYITDASARIRKNATDALTSFADGELLKMLLSGMRRFTKYQPVNVKAERRKIAQALIEANGYCF